MSEGQKTFWLSAAFVVIIAISGGTLWRVATGPTKQEVAALNAKVEATNTALAQVQKATASEAMTKSLSQLANNIKATNEALADIQRTIAASNVRDRLDTLEKNIKAIDASLTTLQKSQAAADLGGKVEALKSEVKILSGNAGALTRVADKIDPLNDKIKSLSDTLADVRKSAALDGVKMQLAALNSRLESTGKAGAGDSPETTGALKSAIAKLKNEIKAQPKEAVVFYLHMPNEKDLPQKIASVQPLDIQFEKVGSTDDNGQAALIIPKLKTLVEGRSGCAISVAGYADTVGGDQVNLEISKKRAQNIAQKIKAAFGDKLKVSVAAWGERRLKAWTPDATANGANRRVDIAVNCKG